LAVPARCANPLEAGTARRASVLEGRARLAPLQRLPDGVTLQVTSFLLSTETVFLMRACRRMHAALQADPMIREISCDWFRERGRKPLLFALCDAEERMLHTPEEPPARGTGLRGAWLDFAASKRKARKNDGQDAGSAQWSRERSLLMAELDARLEAAAFERAAQSLGRLQPSAGGAAWAKGMADSQEPASSRMHQAIDQGDVELVKAGVREFLAISPRLLSNASKIAWLSSANGMCTLIYFSQSPCGRLDAAERGWYEAMQAYAGSLVGSGRLSESELRRLLVRLELVRCDGSRAEVGIVHHAMKNGNPAAAASLLLGIHRANAPAGAKEVLLGSIAQGRGEEGDVSPRTVVQSLGALRARAPEWVDELVEGLKGMEPGWPSAELPRSAGYAVSAS
jgi:hypothetical protein